MQIWEICEDITCKNEWYHKIFKPEIVNKWRDEVNNKDNFEFALSLLQASAAGTNLSKDCDWGDDDQCVQCLEIFRK